THDFKRRLMGKTRKDKSRHKLQMKSDINQVKIEGRGLDLHVPTLLSFLKVSGKLSPFTFNGTNLSCNIL
ncbi:hypothetical protein, partial [Metallosphaera sp.]|uniref:hypothetical protein n=1 Tax=Metallosphaera sp. TaxID=2020860 RepID=UPI00319E3BEA